MKKNLIASVIALAVAFGAFAPTAKAATFLTDLRVGSTGADVVALQSWLIDSGFLVYSGAKGYFGQLTKSALAKYQASVGLPATGFFGPLTRAKLGTAPVVVVPSTGCPVGAMYNTMTGAPCGVTVTVPGCSAGAMFSSTTGAKCDGSAVVVPNTDLGTTDGSITASLDSYVGTGVQIKKSEIKDVIAIKLQATAGNVAVSRFDVRFDKRPWLYFDKIVLKDSNGNVIATKQISGPSDATEITVGTDYMVRFENVNYVVVPNNDKILVVAASVLSATDKLSSDVSVIVSVPASSIRTLNGKGFTDSLGSSSFTRTITLLSSGSTGNIVTRVNPSTPAQRVVTVSTSGTTDDVVLGVFDFKAENRDSTINSFIFTQNTSGDGVARVFKTLKLIDGSRTYNVSSVGTSSTFSNLTIDIKKDEWKTITIKGNIADADEFVNGTTASTSLTANTTNIVGVDSGFNTVSVTSATVASNNIVLLQSGVSVSDIAVTTADVSNGTSAVVKKTVTFKFTLNNTSNNELYVSKYPALALASTSDFTASTTQLLSGATLPNPSTFASDTSTAYAIPAGLSRTFTYQGFVDVANTAVKSGVWKMTNVYFGDDSTNIQEFNINFGLEALRTPFLNF